MMAYEPTYSEAEPTRAEIDAIPGPLVVEFGAPWCGHCQAVQPVLAELIQMHDAIGHIKIYDGRGKPLGRSFRVKLWPNLVFLNSGVVVAQLVRPGETAIRDAIEKLARAAND